MCAHGGDDHICRCKDPLSAVFSAQYEAILNYAPLTSTIHKKFSDSVSFFCFKYIVLHMMWLQVKCIDI